MKQPKPVVFLAAEIAMSCPEVLPGRAAILADKLCRLGRGFNRIAERIANEGDPEEKLSAQLDRWENAAADLVAGLPITFERAALHLQCITVHSRRGAAFTERTTLL